MGLLDQEFVVIDTETTGTEPTEARVIEIAAQSIVGSGAKKRHAFYTKVNPGITIPADSSAVHHITDDDVQHAPNPPTAFLSLIEYMGDAPYVAHNIEYDALVLGSELKRYEMSRDKSSGICTLALARHLAPDSPNHKLQTLKYHLKLSRDAKAHDAGGDVTTTCELLAALIRKYLASQREDSLEAFIAFSRMPAFLQRFPRGKHRMTPTNQVPTDYLEWAVKSNAFEDDRDLQYTVRAELANRRRNHCATHNPGACDSSQVSFSGHKDRPSCKTL